MKCRNGLCEWMSITAIGLVCAVGSMMLVVPARADSQQRPAEAAAADPVPYTPPTGPIFGVPASAGGTPAQQFVFHRAVTASFRAAVPGSTVWVSMFSWDADRVDVQSDSIAAAKDAHTRGVNVRVLLYHKRFQSEAIRSLAATLGTDTTQRSWAKVCVGACLGGSGASLGVHHAKLLVFSKIATAGGRFITDLSYVSSAISPDPTASIRGTTPPSSPTIRPSPKRRPGTWWTWSRTRVT